MKKTKAVVTRTAAELAKALGLSPAEGAEIELRSTLNSKIVAAVRRKGLTHAQVARLAHVSNPRNRYHEPQHQGYFHGPFAPRATCARLHGQDHFPARRLRSALQPARENPAFQLRSSWGLFCGFERFGRLVV